MLCSGATVLAEDPKLPFHGPRYQALIPSRFQADVSPSSPGSSPKPPPSFTCLEHLRIARCPVGILTRCPNHLNWLLKTESFLILIFWEKLWNEFKSSIKQIQKVGRGVYNRRMCIDPTARIVNHHLYVRQAKILWNTSKKFIKEQVFYLTGQLWWTFHCIKHISNNWTLTWPVAQVTRPLTQPQMWLNMNFVPSYEAKHICSERKNRILQTHRCR